MSLLTASAFRDSRRLQTILTVKITRSPGSWDFAEAHMDDGHFTFISTTPSADCSLYTVPFPDIDKQTRLQQQGASDAPSPYMHRFYTFDLSIYPKVHVGALGHVEKISGPFLKKSFHRTLQYGSWSWLADGSRALHSVTIWIGPFASQEEFDRFDPNDATSCGTFNVLFESAVFYSSAVRVLVDNFEQRQSDARTAASATARAAKDAAEAAAEDAAEAAAWAADLAAALAADLADSDAE